MKVENSYLPLYNYKIDMTKLCPLTMVKSVAGGTMHVFQPSDELLSFLKETFDADNIF
jgi:hypothetical protein